MTTVKGQLLQMLQTVAKALGSDPRERLVFVGDARLLSLSPTTSHLRMSEQRMMSTSSSTS